MNRVIDSLLILFFLISVSFLSREHKGPFFYDILIILHSEAWWNKTKEMYYSPQASAPILRFNIYIEIRLFVTANVDYNLDRIK